MKTLTKKLKQKWIEALRSGNYTQGQGFLCNDNKYCCLGVLAKIAGLSSESSYLLINEKDVSYINGLPLDKQHKLADMNDNQGKNFKDIANFIEENINPKR